MPYKKTTKKRVYKKKTYTPRKSTTRKYARKKVYTFTRSIPSVIFNGASFGRFINQTNLQQILGCEFKLNDISTYTEFTNLYDQYKIRKVVIKMTPMISTLVAPTSTTTPTAAGNPGIIGTVYDQDDAGSLANIDAFMQYPSWKSQPVIRSRPIIRTVYPKTRSEVFGAGGITAPAGVGKTGWMDCAYPNVPHFGLKVFIDPYYYQEQGQIWQLESRYYLAFKGVR